jgi:dienelactone hydrolase
MPEMSGHRPGEDSYDTLGRISAETVWHATFGQNGLVREGDPDYGDMAARRRGDGGRDRVAKDLSASHEEISMAVEGAVNLILLCGFCLGAGVS